MAIRLFCLNVFQICDVGSLSFVYSSFIEGMWVMTLAPNASTMSDVVFHSLAVILLMSGWYLVIYLSLVST